MDPQLHRQKQSQSSNNNGANTQTSSNNKMNISEMIQQFEIFISKMKEILKAKGVQGGRELLQETMNEPNSPSKLSQLLIPKKNDFDRNERTRIQKVSTELWNFCVELTSNPKQTSKQNQNQKQTNEFKAALANSLTFSFVFFISFLLLPFFFSERSFCRSVEQFLERRECG